MTSEPTTIEDIYFTARDGLRLHARCYPAPGPVRGRPVLCLPGLTRNGRDFHDLAVALSRHPNSARTVYTFDYRGRGLSEFDPDWHNYTVPVEMLDVLDFITLIGLTDAAVIGTSRGGLIAMLMAVAQPDRRRRRAERHRPRDRARRPRPHQRLRRPRPAADLVGGCRPMMRDSTPPALSRCARAQWEDIARQLYNERNGKPAPGYDKKLANALSVLV